MAVFWKMITLTPLKMVNCFLKPFQIRNDILTKFSGKCKFDNSMIAASISDYDTVYGLIEGTDALAQSINDNGPHATHLYVNDNFRHYASGIFEDDSCPKDRTNHAVINVGYDTTEGYWLIRNSWGGSWGESGHIKMSMGKNTCNVERDSWLPKV